MIIHDSTGLVQGALTTKFVGRDAWCDGKTIDLDRIRRFVATLPANCDFVFDLELPNLLAFDATIYGVDKVKVAVEQAIKVVRVSRAERPDVGFAWYDALIESWTANTNYYESLYRAMARPGLSDDLWFASMESKHAAALKKIEWANDQLADLHAEQQLLCVRCYFALNASARQRSQIIEWSQREGDRLAHGKPVQILYKPNTQTGSTMKVLSYQQIAEDVAAMKRSRVRRLCLWKDSNTPNSAILEVSAAAELSQGASAS